MELKLYMLQKCTVDLNSLEMSSVLQFCTECSRISGFKMKRNYWTKSETTTPKRRQKFYST